MGYVQRETADERLKRYQGLKKKARNIVNDAEQLDIRFQQLIADSTVQIEKDEVAAVRTQFIDALKAKLNIV